MIDYEKLGLFYLGKKFDLVQGRPLSDLMLYDSRDLTTHAVCVGMTGSGKTGLCLCIIEEAAIDRIPVLAIDPKGDLGNLLLTFPGLNPSDFKPWVDPREAARKGQDLDTYASTVANQWRDGLAAWQQPPERIQRFRDAVDIAIYTPGSTAGLPLSVLRSFHVPPRQLREDGDLYREHIQSTAAGVLALAGVTGDPMTSRENLLVGKLLDHAWTSNHSLDLPMLITGIQKPPFDRVGRLDIEAFYPAPDRFALAVKLNNLLASPGFSSWVEGTPLDINRLLYREDGTPRVSILSIAHLSEAERMAFVTILLNEVLSWVRTQPGTSSLRALLYMDEIFGFFPPSANPPAKRPMLTLLKQARAYGLGIMLATQNPVDLDYKGLANTGTWFLGRLQTERDKMRVIDGLQSASDAAGAGFDRKRLESLLSSLGNRVFLMNNVHDDGPVVFQTRWALSYLRGPLTREEIKGLTKPALPEDLVNSPAAGPDTGALSRLPQEESAGEPASLPQARFNPAASTRPLIDPGITERFARPHAEAETIQYIPCLYTTARVHYVDAKTKANVDKWETFPILARADDRTISGDPWTGAIELKTPPDMDDHPVNAGAQFATLPAECTRARSYSVWTKKLKDHLYRERPLPLLFCPELKLYSWPHEDEAQFRIRLNMKAREARDEKVDQLRARFRPRRDAIENKIRSAEERLQREKNQASKSTFDAVLSVGGSVLDSFLGNRRSRSRTSKTTAARNASRAAQQRAEAAAVSETLSSLKSQRDELDLDFEREERELEYTLGAHRLEIKSYPITPRKADISVEPVLLLWMLEQDLPGAQSTVYV